jgi:hypothetical protein
MARCPPCSGWSPGHHRRASCYRINETIAASLALAHFPARQRDLRRIGLLSG